MPAPVDKYFKEVKKSNPEYSDEKAWATAWSIYCKHKNPGSDHCKRPPSEYLKEASMTSRIVARFEAGKPADPTKNMSPEDAAKWKDMNEEYGDKFKEASALQTFSDAVIVRKLVAKTKLATSDMDTEEELAIACTMIELKAGYRAKTLDEMGLGPYTPENPHIKKLISKGYIKVQGKAMVPNKTKIDKDLKTHEAPAKYKKYLSNPSMHFKKTGE